MQPGLLQYVQQRFDVKGYRQRQSIPATMIAARRHLHFPRARPIGTNGPFNLRLLIQPAPPGHILGVVDITKVHLNQPGAAGSRRPVASYPPPANQPPTPDYQPPAPSYQAPPTQGPVSQPRSNRPRPSNRRTYGRYASGPIMGSGALLLPAQVNKVSLLRPTRRPRPNNRAVLLADFPTPTLYSYLLPPIRPNHP